MAAGFQSHIDKIHGIVQADKACCGCPDPIRLKNTFDQEWTPAANEFLKPHGLKVEVSGFYTVRHSSHRTNCPAPPRTEAARSSGGAKARLRVTVQRPIMRSTTANLRSRTSSSNSKRFDEEVLLQVANVALLQDDRHDGVRQARDEGRRLCCSCACRRRGGHIDTITALSCDHAAVWARCATRGSAARMIWRARARARGATRECRVALGCGCIQLLGSSTGAPG